MWERLWQESQCSAAYTDVPGAAVSLSWGWAEGSAQAGWQHCLDGSWLASKAARAGGAGDFSCILLIDGAWDRGCKYYCWNWHGPKVWLTGPNKTGMFLWVCYMGWVPQTGLQAHFRKQALQQHIPSLARGLSLGWVLLWSGCSGLVLLLVYDNVCYTQGTASFVWGCLLKIKAIQLCSEDFSSEVLTFLQPLGRNRRGPSSKRHEHLTFLEGTLENISIILRMHSKIRKR